MKKRSSPTSTQDELREKLIGLGEHSIHKSYYPELQKQLDSLNERMELAELVAEIGQAMTEEKNLRSSLQRCSDALEQRTDAGFVRIWTLDPVGETLKLQASSGLYTHIDGAHSRLRIRDYPSKISSIVRERKPFLTNQVEGNTQFHDQKWVKQQGIVAFAGYPLAVQQRLVGVIALFAQKPLNETVLKTLETISNQISVGIERYMALDAYRSALANTRESHEKVNVILRSVADALLVIDNNQRILHMNQAAEALLGVSLTTVENKRIDQVTKESALLDYLALINQLTTLNHDIDLNIYDMARNEQRIIQARAAHLKGDISGAGLVVSLRDVTQDREVTRMKSEFIMTAAHELRTPLTSIMGFAELLDTKEWDAETRREYLAHIIDKAGSLEHIIDELLDLSRIESGRGLSLNYSHWDLGKTLKKFIARYQVEYREYRFKANISEKLGMIHADQGKYLQILDNLLSNAIKYSPQHTEITFDAQCLNNLLQIKIIDQGIGMSEDQVANCFEKFYRADTSNTAIGGLGLGLSIVRHIVESHNGQIKIESRPGQGTTVTVTIPIECEPDSAVHH